MNGLVTAKVDVSAFNLALTDYAIRRKKSVRDVIAQKATDVAFKISNALKAYTPAKNAVRSSRLAKLKNRSIGVKIREGLKELIARKYHASARLSDKKTVISRKSKRKVATGTVVFRKKRLNLQALTVMAELNLRERGRGYRPFATRVSFKPFIGASITSMSSELKGRYGQELAKFSLKHSDDYTVARFEWGNDPTSEIGKALDNSSGRAAIQKGIDDATASLVSETEKALASAAKAAGIKP